MTIFYVLLVLLVAVLVSTITPLYDLTIEFFTGYTGDLFSRPKLSCCDFDNKF